VSAGAALAPRPYQSEAIQAVHREWKNGILRPAIILPTGSGKTIVVSHLIAEICAIGGRVLFLAHREELIDQGADKIRAVATGLRVGIEMASRKASLLDDVVVASVPTLASAKRRSRWPRDHFTVVICDECHHALSTTYVAVMDHFGCYSSTRSLGVTATLARGDGAGLGSVWQGVAYEKSLLEMFADGYLVVPRGQRVQVGIDLSQVRSRGGDYMASELGEALSDAGFEQAVARAYREHGGDRPGLVFTPTVATAHSCAAALREAGYKAEAVWGEMEKAARTAAVNGLRNGELDILVNCSVLTEGTAIPRAEVAVIARPTKSGVLYRQMTGRVLRPFPGKTEALVIDLVGSTADHRLCTLIDLADGEIKEKPKKKPEDDEPDEVQDGESLVDAVARIEKAKLTVTSTAVNLFGESSENWLRTPGGHWFIPAAGGGQVFVREWVAPDGTTKGFAVAHMARGADEPIPLGRAPELPLAQALGEEQARRLERAAARERAAATGVASRVAPTGRFAAWRTRAQPSPKQLATAARHGIAVPEGATAGQVSDLIAIRFAERIDRFFDGRDAA